MEKVLSVLEPVFCSAIINVITYYLLFRRSYEEDFCYPAILADSAGGISFDVGDQRHVLSLLRG